MKKETTKKERDTKKVGLVIAATAGTIGTIGLGALCVVLAKDNKNLKLKNSIAKEAYEGIVEKFVQQTEAYEELVRKTAEQNETIELVKNVVRDVMIDRLIKNEEKVLSRTENKITRIMAKNLTETTKTVLEELNVDRQNSIDTIADFVKAKKALHE